MRRKSKSLLRFGRCSCQVGADAEALEQAAHAGLGAGRGSTSLRRTKSDSAIVSTWCDALADACRPCGGSGVTPPAASVPFRPPSGSRPTISTSTASIRWP